MVHDGQLVKFFVERSEKQYRKGNVYKARVVSVEPHLQAAFVEIENRQHAFLSASDVIYPDAGESLLSTTRKKSVKKKIEDDDQTDNEGKDVLDEDEGRVNHRGKHRIEDLLKPGKEILVQIIKEGIGKKAPAVTTYLSFAGQYMVLAPGMDRSGVSRQISSSKERTRLKEALEKMTIPPECGVVVRTAAEGVTKKDLNADIRDLKNFWKDLKAAAKKSKTPAALHVEAGLITRIVRDYYQSDFDSIHVDSQAAYDELKEYFEKHLPDGVDKLRHFKGDKTIFNMHGIDQTVRGLYMREVKMAGGGWLTFDQTEAMLTIDVNSGNYKEGNDDEEAATKLNVMAAREVARQVQLRNVGGLIMIDFVDMKKQSNRTKVTKELENAFRDDKAKINILQISRLGVLEMSRQRSGESLKKSMYSNCKHCAGTGMVPSLTFSSLGVLRRIRECVSSYKGNMLKVYTTREVALEVLNQNREILAALEKEHNVEIRILTDETMQEGDCNIDERGKRKQENGKPNNAPHQNHNQPPAQNQNQYQKQQQSDDSQDSSNKKRKRRRRNRKRKDRNPNQEYQRNDPNAPKLGVIRESGDASEKEDKRENQPEKQRDDRRDDRPEPKLDNTRPNQPLPEKQKDSDGSNSGSNSNDRSSNRSPNSRRKGNRPPNKDRNKKSEGYIQVDSGPVGKKTSGPQSSGETKKAETPSNAESSNGKDPSPKKQTQKRRRPPRKKSSSSRDENAGDSSSETSEKKPVRRRRAPKKTAKKQDDGAVLKNEDKSDNAPT